MAKYTNKLSEQKSLYLQQHAHNPVNWYPWGDEALSLARSEDKLLLVSIGYSSCHWCHVMEHETFDNEHVAEVMNENFICIKVDREERPDIDNIFMTAVQLMSGSGGWPLNSIALPDGRSVWGGTYFKPDKWVKIISEIAGYYRSNRTEMEKYAAELSQGVVSSSMIADRPAGNYTISDLKAGVRRWKNSFDAVHGGTIGAPKFPMPVNLGLMLHYGHLLQDKEVLDHAALTLLKIAGGGIYDHAGGGFARYSVDERWRVPHFEKMLYDNAQLIEVYSDAWLLFRNERFREVVYQSIAFLRREMTSADGLFYSSIDADSEGEEGLFYVWTESQLSDAGLPERTLFDKYFGINPSNLWEGKYYVLHTPLSDSDFCRREGVDVESLAMMKAVWQNRLMEVRSKRVRPVTDTKIIASWNGMMIHSLVKAARAFGEEEFLKMAVGSMEELLLKADTGNGSLTRIIKSDDLSRAGFLDDYAFVIQGLISLYESTGEERWIDLALTMTRKTITDFYDKEMGLFFYCSKDSGVLLTNYAEQNDNVVPSSNSVMASNLLRLGHLIPDSSFLETAEMMYKKVADNATRYPHGYAGWNRVLLGLTLPFSEIVVTGHDMKSRLKEIFEVYIPNAVFAATVAESSKPLFQNRFVDGKTLIYQCVDNSCGLPVEEVKYLKL